VCDLETSRMGAPYIYDISRLRVKVPSRPTHGPPLPPPFNLLTKLHLWYHEMYIDFRNLSKE